jgi:hypothetical protein
MNKEMYVEILADEMSGSLEHLGLNRAEVVFQHDNASTHKAKVCLDCLDDHGIEVMEWPPYSPDLNPIENLWAELKRCLGTQENAPVGIHEPWDRVQAESNGLEEEYCQKLVKSMPNRMTMVLKNKGNVIKY